LAICVQKKPYAHYVLRRPSARSMALALLSLFT